MKITKWHILGIVVLAVILGIWFMPVVPSKDSEGNETVARWMVVHLRRKMPVSEE